MSKVLVRPSGKSLGYISHYRNTRSPDLIPKPKIFREQTIVCHRVNATGHLASFLPSLNILEPFNCRQNNSPRRIFINSTKNNRPVHLNLPDRLFRLNRLAGLDRLARPDRFKPYSLRTWRRGSTRAAGSQTCRRRSTSRRAHSRSSRRGGCNGC